MTRSSHLEEKLSPSSNGCECDGFPWDSSWMLVLDILDLDFIDNSKASAVQQLLQQNV